MNQKKKQIDLKKKRKMSDKVKEISCLVLKYETRIAVLNVRK